MSCSLFMVERPGIFRARAFCSRASLVSSLSESPRDTPFLEAAARFADVFRACCFSLEGLLLPEPLRSPPPDCLLTVAHAMASDRSCSLFMVERPGIFRARAFCSRASLVSSLSESPRDTPFLEAAARFADVFRACCFSLEGLLLPEPLRSPPPDCLLTVAHAMA